MHSMHMVTKRLMSIEGVIMLYWLVFWLTNGLDKFLHGTDLILFEWFGKDRTDQMSGYFATLNLPKEWADQVLPLIGVWEVVIASLFLIAYIWLARRSHLNALILARYGFFMTILIFIMFSAFDVLVGDRFELFEHNALHNYGHSDVVRGHIS